MNQATTSAPRQAMLARESRRRRTFAIISHPDAGKTTLTEKLLLFGGAIQLAGTVKARKSGRFAASDWMAVEQQRGISVSSSVMQFEYDGYVINLLDTPGHQDFSEDTYRVLTAVDAALMVIDPAKGVEAQTIRLLEVCRLRNTPIITFINKMDLEVRDPIELIDEIEDVLQIRCTPIIWPVGMAKSFRGVFHLLRDEMHRFRPGQGNENVEVESVRGIGDPSLEALYPMEVGPLREEVELVRGASDPFDQQAYLQGEQTPVFFGSAINNFGVRELLRAVIEWAPPPQPRDAGVRAVDPLEPTFSGFVFKIQANMDPRHRDRIAFLRVCSGRLTLFEIVSHRLTEEYGVAAVFGPVRVHAARWVVAPDHKQLGDFEKANHERLATDVDGNPVFLAESNAILLLTQERWPEVELRTTREHGEQLNKEK